MSEFISGENDRIVIGHTAYLVDRLPGGVLVTRSELTSVALKALSAQQQIYTANDFAQAGRSAGKTENFGLGVMRNAACKLVKYYDRSIIASNDRAWPSRDADVSTIQAIINGQIDLQSGSHVRLLIEQAAVEEVYQHGWPANEKDHGPLKLGGVGHRVISYLLDKPERQFSRPALRIVR